MATFSCSAKARSTSALNSSVSLRPQRDRLRGERVARPPSVDRNNVFDPPGAGGAHDDPVGERQRFIDVMGDEDDRGATFAPDIEQKTLHFCPRQHIERGKRRLTRSGKWLSI
jgi:hypothetical protein